MKHVAFIMAGLISMPTLAGCATGPRTEATSPPFVLPDSPGTLRVRIYYSKSPANLNATGPYVFQLKKGGKAYSSGSASRVRAMSGKMVFGHQSLRGDVIVSPATSTDTLKINGRRYRG